MGKKGQRAIESVDLFVENQTGLTFELEDADGLARQIKRGGGRPITLSTVVAGRPADERYSRNLL